MEFKDISKKVGWDHQELPYPSLKRVEIAIKSNDCESLLRWNRFLLSPTSPDKVKIIHRVADGLKEVKRRLN